MSAAGRLPSRPDRRERVGTECEVLAARLIDRALRPLLPPGFLYDTQVCFSLCSALTCFCFSINQQAAAFDGACAHGVKHLHVSGKISKTRLSVGFQPALLTAATARGCRLCCDVLWGCVFVLCAWRAAGVGAGAVCRRQHRPRGCCNQCSQCCTAAVPTHTLHTPHRVSGLASSALLRLDCTLAGGFEMVWAPNKGYLI